MNIEVGDIVTRFGSPGTFMIVLKVIRKKGLRILRVRGNAPWLGEMQYELLTDDVARHWKEITNENSS